MSNTPFVSIIMPAFNSDKYLEETILSVINQTYKNFELIIINDCSTDSTISIIKKYLLIEPRIKLISNIVNLGVSESRNIGIRNILGKYVAFLDSDDIWFSTKLEKQINFMEKNNFNFTYTSYFMFNSPSLNSRKLVQAPKTINHKQLLGNTIIGCCTVIYNSYVFKNVIMPKVKHGEDFLTWVSILSKGEVAYGLREPLSFYRKTNNSRSGNKIKSLIHQFSNYHNYLKFNLFFSLFLTFKFSLLAIKKHYL